MRLSRISIENFRLLRAAEIDLTEDPIVTILVGANNSGKTSAVDALRLFTQGNARKFEISDFSLSTRHMFAAAEAAILTPPANEDKQLPPTLPAISATLVFRYEDQAADLAVAGDLLMDLDIGSFQVAAQVEFAAKEVAKLAADFKKERREGESLYDFLGPRLSSYFGLFYYKVNLDTGEREPLKDGTILNRLIKVDFVPAQRHMADEDGSQSTRLSAMLHTHYERRYKVDNPDDYKDLEAVLSSQSKELSTRYMTAFGGLLGGIEQFGAAKGRAPKLSIQAQLKAETLFRDTTRVFYSAELEAAVAGTPPQLYDLPERYNGLGYKNLFYMILQLRSFREELENSDAVRPRVHLILLEEPEVHLHPQVQTVFVGEVAKFLTAAGEKDVQIVLTTHSSHIVANSGFSPIRYFRRKGGAVEVKDLLKFDRSPKSEPEKAAMSFLRSYMTQTRCDLFFSDKAILIEGQVERLLLPAMIRKCAVGAHSGLASDYLSIMEVGGAHAHIFKALIEFLEVPTLVVTDLDSVGADGKRCPVASGTSTSNATLKKWLPAKTLLADLHAAGPDAKTAASAHVAYQVPEAKAALCGRSFEEAFIYANLKWLVDNQALLLATGSEFEGKTTDELGKAAFAMSLNKVAFALDLMVQDGWQTPKYIADGLRWLAERPAL